MSLLSQLRLAAAAFMERLRNWRRQSMPSTDGPPLPSELAEMGLNGSKQRMEWRRSSGRALRRSSTSFAIVTRFHRGVFLGGSGTYLFQYQWETSLSSKKLNKNRW
jgi:hypothetical protein